MQLLLSTTFTLFLATLTICEAVQVCTKQCSEPNCPTSQTSEVECDHGFCEWGKCVCYNCWSGTNCDHPRNDHAPSFVTSQKEVSIPSTTELGDFVIQVTAYDDDADDCASIDCPCGDIVYRLENEGDFDDFIIDSATGAIRINSDIYGSIHTLWNLKVTATNQIEDAGAARTASMQVVVRVTEDQSRRWRDDRAKENVYTDQHHSRHRRSIDPPLTTEIIPVEPTFYMQKKGMYENVTEMSVGSKIELQLQMHMPAGGTDLLVELFTPDNDTTIMILCNPRVTHVGANLDQSLIDTPRTMEAREPGSIEFTRAVFDFGVVNNSDVVQTTEANMIHLDWTVIRIFSDAENDTKYWISIGAEYNNKSNVWVGQTAVNANGTDEALSDTPTFNITGPTDVEVGTCVEFQVNMYIPYPYTTLQFDAHAPMNDSDNGVVSICGAYIKDVAENYECSIDTENLEFVPYPATGDGARGNSMVSLDIGTNVINKGALDPTNTEDKNRISVTFLVYIYDEDQYIGRSFYIGATLAMGASQIWAAQIELTAVARTPAVLVGTPSFSFSLAAGDGTVAMGQVAIFWLDVITPENSDGDYVLEFLMPYSDPIASATVCRVRVVSQGSNIPCIGAVEANITSRAGLDYDDIAYYPIGRIKNAGFVTGNDTENTIRVEVTALILNTTYTEPGNNLTFTAGVKYGSNQLYVATGVLTTNTSDASQLNDTTPEFNMTYMIGDGEVPVGGQAAVSFEITTQPGGLYQPMDVEVVMPYENNSAVMSICRVEVMSAGLNLPCLKIVPVNESIVCSSKSNDSVNDKCVFSLGTVCNIGEDLVAGEEDVIKIKIVVKLEDHINVVNGSGHYISTGIMFSQMRMWVGQIKVTALRDMPFVDYPADKQPTVVVLRADGLTTDAAGPGETIVYNMIIKPAPLSFAQWKISASTSSAALSICLLRISEFGFGIPCLNKSLEANYTERVGLGTNEHAFIDLPIANVVEDIALDNTTFDNTTVVIQAIVHVDASAAAGSVSFSFETDFGDNGVDTTESISLTVGASVSMPNVTLNTSIPSLEFSLSSFTDQPPEALITFGEIKTFSFAITIVPSSCNFLRVKFMGPLPTFDLMQLCAASILFVGRNIPCIKKRNIDAVFTTRVGSTVKDMVSLDLGYTCHFLISDDPIDDQIVIELVARLTPVNSLVEGDLIWISATTRVNDDLIYVSQLANNITVTEIIPQNSAFNSTYLNITLNSTASDSFGYPGQTFDVTFLASIPPNSTARAIIKVASPVSTSAAMTVTHITVTASGVNLGCLEDQASVFFIPVCNSTLHTSQNDTCELDLGVISNSGHTYRGDRFEEGDNDVEFTATFRMADSVDSTNGSIYAITAELSYGNDTQGGDADIVVLRDQTEQPDIELNATISENITFTENDVVHIQADLRHTPQSTAEGRNVSATFYYPPYLKFHSLTNLTYIRPSPEYTITNATEANGVSVTFDSLYFSDEVSFAVGLTFDLHLGQDAAVTDAQSAFDVQSNIIHRPGHVNASGTIFMSRLNKLAFKVIPPESLACSPQVLGLAFGGLADDCQLSGSYGWDTIIGGSSVFTPATRGSAFLRYLQVELGNVTMVTKVVLEHPIGKAPITELTMAYSDDGINFADGDTINPTGSLSTEILNIPSKIEARYVRLVVNEPADMDVGIRAEFHGCVGSDDVSSNDICESDTWESRPKKDYYTRSILETGGTVYFCDPNPEKDLRGRCFFSADGSQWTAMDKRVAGLLGMHAASNTLYAVSADDRSTIASDDAGASWFTVSDDLYSDAAADGLVLADEVDWIENPLVYQGTWSADYQGIYKGTKQKMDWTKCCV